MIMKDMIKKHIAGLTEYMLECGYEIAPLPSVSLRSDDSEANDFLGKTAYYEPQTKTIVLYIKNRHPKDIVRSFAHEMVHHKQNLEGRLDAASVGDSGDPKYTQNNSMLREIEAEAYEYGNLMFRDYCDNMKYGQ